MEEIEIPISLGKKTALTFVVDSNGKITIKETGEETSIPILLSVIRELSEVIKTAHTTIRLNLLRELNKDKLAKE